MITFTSIQAGWHWGPTGLTKALWACPHNFVTEPHTLRLLYILACKLAYGQHMLGCQPLAGTGALGPSRALRAYPENFVTEPHRRFRLLYIDRYHLSIITFYYIVCVLSLVTNFQWGKIFSHFLSPLEIYTNLKQPHYKNY